MLSPLVLTKGKENKKVCFSSEPVHIITNDEEMNVVEPLDTNYEKAKMQECVNACINLDKVQTGKLLNPLMKHKDLFQDKRGSCKEDEDSKKSNLK